MITITPTGKGMYMWNYQLTIAEIVTRCLDLGINHIILKIADGTVEFAANYNKLALITELQKVGIDVWGWQYVYLTAPLAEAAIVKRLMAKYPLKGFIVDAEKEAKGQPGPAAAYMKELRSGDGGNFPVGLASYRRPDYHRTFPWAEFRTRVDFDMPQVYWIDAHNPVEQLIASYKVFSEMTPKLPYLPTGSAWKTSTWEPSPKEIEDFMAYAMNHGMPGVNFWEFNKTYTRPTLWKAIKSFQWKKVAPAPAPGPVPGLDEVWQAIQDLRVRLNDTLGELGQVAFKATNNTKAITALEQTLRLMPVREKFKMKERKAAKFICAVNGVGKPVFTVYPSDTAEPSKQVILDKDRVVEVLPTPITGDGGVKMFPLYWTPEIPVQLYVDVDAGELWPK